jgi:hypothetical protein
MSMLAALAIMIGSAVAAQPAQAAYWSAFEVVSNAPAQYLGKYVSVDNANGGPLKANRSTIGAWEKFELVLLGPYAYAFKAKMNLKYVCAEQGGAKPLVANRSQRGLWETFNFTWDTNGFKISVPANGMWIGVQADGTLLANKTQAQATVFDEVYNV